MFRVTGNNVERGTATLAKRGERVLKNEGESDGFLCQTRGKAGR